MGTHVDDEHYFSSSDERSVREDHPDFRGHATSTRWSEFVGPRTKVHILDEATRGYRKHGISLRIQAGSFWKSKVSGLGSVHWTF